MATALSDETIVGASIVEHITHCECYEDGDEESDVFLRDGDKAIVEDEELLENRRSILILYSLSSLLL